MAYVEAAVKTEGVLRGTVDVAPATDSGAGLVDASKVFDFPVRSQREEEAPVPRVTEGGLSVPSELAISCMRSENFVIIGL